MGRDAGSAAAPYAAHDFNPRARVGRDATWARLRRRIAYFNPRARVGRDIRGAKEAEAREDFNPRAPHGGATFCRKCRQDVAGFQSTRPAWGRDSGERQNGVKGDISIHAPAWGATALYAAQSRRVLVISIHAPAWGATCLNVLVGHHHSISIHAPAWSATSRSCFQITQYLFQSTRPRGARQRQIVGFRAVAFISIHAPAWGATRCLRLSVTCLTYFNPRARVGRDSCFT